MRTHAGAVHVPEEESVGGYRALLKAHSGRHAPRLSSSFFFLLKQERKRMNCTLSLLSLFSLAKARKKKREYPAELSCGGLREASCRRQNASRRAFGDEDGLPLWL